MVVEIAVRDKGLTRHKIDAMHIFEYRNDAVGGNDADQFEIGCLSVFNFRSC